MSDFKNQNLGHDLPMGNSGLIIPTMEVANCNLNLTEAPVEGEQALNIVAEKKVKYAVRFHTIQESAWVMRAKESKKDVELKVSWGRNKEQKFTAGDAWTQIDFGKPPRNSIWIVEIEIKFGESFDLWPFSVYQETEKPLKSK